VIEAKFHDQDDLRVEPFQVTANRVTMGGGDRVEVQLYQSSNSVWCTPSGSPLTCVSSSGVRSEVSRRGFLRLT